MPCLTMDVRWNYVMVLVVVSAILSHHAKGELSPETVQTAIKEAFQIAIAEQSEQENINKALFQQGIEGDMQSEDHRKFLENVFQSMMDSNVEQVSQASVIIRATQELTRILGLPLHKLKQLPSVQMLWQKMSRPFCVPRMPICSKNAPYRTIDGSCNNVNFPTWGMSHRDQQRYLPAHYHDGVSIPRQVGVLGIPLPSARVVSNALHRTARTDLLERKDSVMLMQFGQLLDHDIIDTPTLKGENGADIACCALTKEMARMRSACFPISIPPGDPRFSTPCMNFVRSATANNDQCKLGQRHQINQATSFIDASYLYGADTDTAISLRSFQRGMLRMNKRGLFKPTDPHNCKPNSPGDYCMKSGDKRIHVVPGLASTQVLFLREHNRIAAILGDINPHWDDETVYQETRKIVSALNQHITYTEYLPRILGQKYMVKYGLKSKKLGFNTAYNPSVDATLNNAFGAAAFRFGHSQIPGNIDVLMENMGRMSFGLEDTFNSPTVVLLKNGEGCDGVNNWLKTDRGGKSDRFLEPAVRDNLFLDKRGRSFDLAALNIQRGRDHGVPGYNAWRKWCGLPVAVHFGMGPGGLIDMDPESSAILSKLYSHPDDIDLFSGGLAERHIPGGRMGPTFACIVGSQFREIKIGDRFWYENNFPNTGFTLEQLGEIKKIRLSNVLCRNSKISVVSPDAFSVPSGRNPPIHCGKVYDIDFRFWKDVRSTFPLSKMYQPPLVPMKNLVAYHK